MYVPAGLRSGVQRVGDHTIGGGGATGPGTGIIYIYMVQICNSSLPPAIIMIPRIEYIISLESNYYARYLCLVPPPCGVGWVGLGWNGGNIYIFT